MIYVLAALTSIAVVVCLSAALFGWFKLSLHRFDVTTAKALLTRWDAELADLSEAERDHHRMQPPVEVLEAIATLPSPRLGRVHLSYTR